MAQTYFEHHKLLITHLCRVAENCLQQPEWLTDENWQTLVSQLQTLSASEKQSDSMMQLGQSVLCRIVAGHPQLMPEVHRDLLWFFGGDCLHFMPDGEIESYQALDEKRHLAESRGDKFNYAAERAAVFGLN